MAEQHVDQGEVVKYFTRARKFPMLLGRMPDGTKIPGGPYTVQQLLAAIAVLTGGSLSMGWWGIFGGIGNVVLLLGAAFGAVFVVGRIPLHGRNPFYAVAGLYRAMNAPSTGRYQGRPIRLRRPRRVRHAVNVYLGALPGAEASTAYATQVAVAATPGDVRRRLNGKPPEEGVERLREPESARPSQAPLTSVQALLALGPDAKDRRSVGSSS